MFENWEKILKTHYMYKNYIKWKNIPGFNSVRWQITKNYKWEFYSGQKN